MPVTINVSLNKEISFPEHRSFDVSCALTFDDESSDPLDLERLQRHIHCATSACRRAIEEDVPEQQQG